MEKVWVMLGFEKERGTRCTGKPVRIRRGPATVSGEAVFRPGER